MDDIEQLNAKLALAHVCVLIIQGRADDQLDDIAEALKARREARRVELAIKNHTELKVGARVRLVRIRPLYLAGMTGVVTKSMPGEFVVRLDSGKAGNYRPDVKVRAHMVEGI